jgi:hypothetical protein
VQEAVHDEVNSKENGERRAHPDEKGSS